ncbi:type II toxin-antitoxin system HicB family antitoxin [Enterococcus dongliensis]|uniref:type II toxin-antitoxin system HicB family antitoxin n=1 Tax=Enterococcus dongliensis TaxID=2559925 RepID=UPI00288F6900|nr:type II toxin-antitoxin system HicB family antitoxin [Enterococcus dongliensis]MDT2613170.1 type II toxin-antitoxin system HicB family antitoxin [Enterococcus dongliensis]
MIMYPAIFSPEGEYYNVTFPDVPEAITFGQGIDEAVEMAQSVLGLALYDQDSFPKATNPKDVRLNNENNNDFIVAITLDIAEYRKNNHSKVVRKNISIPEWLNILAEKENINFSQALTEALKEKLGV